MNKAPKKTKDGNVNPIQKLSDIVPELAYFDTAKKQVSHSLFLTKARITARYSKEKNLSKDKKSEIKSLFLAEYTIATTYMRDFLLGLPDLSRDERNYWHRKLTEFYGKTKDLLFESLDNNVSNQHKFNELMREELDINQGLAFDADSYQGLGTIDKKTRVVKFPEPAGTRQNIEPAKKPAGTEPNTKRERGEMSKWYQTNTFKFVVIPLVVSLFLGIPAWLSLYNKTDHDPSGNTSISSEVKTSGDSSPAIITSGPNSPVTVNYDSSESKTKQIAENKLNLSLKNICQDIESRPLVQQQETAMHYIGVQLKEQELELFDIYLEDNKFGLNMIIPGQPDVTFLKGIRIYFSVDRHQYPELHAAKKGLKFYVTGKIEEVDKFMIKLSDVSLKFD